MATFNYQDFYKVKSPTGFDIFRTGGQKLSYEEALPMFQTGFNVENIPLQQETIPGSTPALAPDSATAPRGLSGNAASLNVGERAFDPATQKQYLKTAEGFRWIQDEATLNELVKQGVVKGGYTAVNPAELGTIGTPIALTEITGTKNDSKKEPSLVNIPENLPNEFKLVLQGITSALEGLIKAGKTINTQVDITPEKVASFLTQAQTELSPYYTQEQNLTIQDITRELSDLSGGLERGREDILRNEGLAQEQISESAAERGVAFSTQRQKSERLQREQSQRSLQDIQRQAETGAGTIGRAGERFLGTEAFKGVSIPQFKSLSFGEVSMPSKPSFTPSAMPIKGELERNRLTAEQLRLAELKKAERERASLSFG